MICCDPTPICRACIPNQIQNMNACAKLLFAIAVIAAVGAVICVVLGATINPSPLVADILTYSGVFSLVLSIGLFSLLRRSLNGSGRGGLGRIGTLRAVPDRTARSVRETAYSYSGRRININVDKREVRQIPFYHLNLFVQMVVQHVQENDTADIHVVFIGQRGIDAGGLARDYIDDLFLGITESEHLRFATIESTSLLVPTAEMGDMRTLQACYQLGQVMMFCHPSYNIGYHLDPSIFTIAFALTADEINTPFDDLGEDSIRKLYNLLPFAQGNENLTILLQLFFKGRWDEADLEQAVEYAGYAGAEIPEEYKNDESRVRGYISGALGDFYGRQLRAMHAIAGGMKSVCKKGEAANDVALDMHWNEHYFESDPQPFATRLLGSIDPGHVAGSLNYRGGNEEVQKKVGWLQEWIRGEATSVEVRQFLKFVTGGSCLREGSAITVSEMADSLPTPTANTCGNQLNIAGVPCGSFEVNDHTKASFLLCVKSVISGEGAGYAFH